VYLTLTNELAVSEFAVATQQCPAKISNEYGKQLCQDKGKHNHVFIVIPTSTYAISYDLTKYTIRHEGTLESFLDMKLIALKKHMPSRTQPETWI